MLGIVYIIGFDNGVRIGKTIRCIYNECLGQKIKYIAVDDILLFESKLLNNMMKISIPRDTKTFCMAFDDATTIFDKTCEEYSGRDMLE